MTHQTTTPSVLPATAKSGINWSTRQILRNQLLGVNENGTGKTSVALAQSSLSVTNTLYAINNTMLPGNYRGGLPVRPYSAVYDPVNGYTYLNDAGSNLIPVLKNGRVIAYITTFGSIDGITVDSTNGLLYVSSSSAGKVGIINGTTIEDTLNVSEPVYGGPSALCFDPATGIVYAEEFNNMVMINGSSIQGNFSFPSSDQSIVSWLVYDPSNGYIYSSGIDQVAVFKGTGVVATIQNNLTSVNFMLGLTYDQQNGYVYAVLGQTIQVINGTKTVGYITVNNYADAAGLFDVEYNPGNSEVYVTNRWHSTIDIVKGLKIVGEVRVPDIAPLDSYWSSATIERSIWGMEYIPSGSSVYIIESGYSNPSILNLSNTNNMGNITLTDSLQGSAFDTQNGCLYVANDANNTVVVIANDSVKGYLSALGNAPGQLLFDPVNGYVYVVDTGSNTVCVLDQLGAVGLVRVGASPCSIAMNDSSGLVYVANKATGNISVINGTAVISTIQTGAVPQNVIDTNYGGYATSSPTSVAYDSADGRVYALDNYRYRLDLISNNTIISTVGLPDQVSSIVYNPSNGYIYCDVAFSNSTIVISGEKIISTLTVNGSSGVLYYNPSSGQVYDMLKSGVIDIINGLNLTGSFTAGESPISASYSGSDSQTYIVNSGSGTITLLNQTVEKRYATYFNESGLTTGAPWSVQVDGLRISGNTPSLSFDALNGSYTFSIPISNVTNGSAFEADSPVANFHVNGTSVTIDVVFVKIPLTPLTINETGLPSGQQWWFNTSLRQSFSTVGSVMKVEVPLGQMNYTAQTLSRDWFTVTGNTSVKTSQPYLDVVFKPYLTNVTLSYTYFGFIFNPIYENIYINLSDNRSYSMVAYNGSGQLNIALPNGTYGYSISSLSGRFHGSILAIAKTDGSGNLIAISEGDVKLLDVWSPPNGALNAGFQMLPMTVPVSFSETGLPPGTSWHVNVTGMYSNYSYSSALNLSTGYSQSLLQFNGTYQYVASASIPYYSTANGSYNVTGVFNMSTLSANPVPIVVHFRPANYTFTVSEIGIPPSYSWSVTINNTTYISNSSSLSLLLPAGNYSYKFHNTSDFYVTAQNGNTSIPVNDSLSVEYYQYAQLEGFINLSEIQTSNQNPLAPITYQVSVLVNNESVNLTGDLFMLKVPAGNYTIEVLLPGGPYYRNITLSTGEIYLFTFPLPKRPTGNPLLQWQLVAAILAAVTIAELSLLLVTVTRRRRRL